MNIRPWSEEFSDFLQDESKKTGRADGLCFPATEADVVEAVREAYARGIPLTTQGGRTGITAGAVPDGGWIINLSGMKRIKALRYDAAADGFSLVVEPGVVLGDVQRALEKTDFDTTGWGADSLNALALMKQRGTFFFTPDPTETTATLGGMAACNASGARSFKYGSMRPHVKSLRVVVRDGRVLHLTRGVEQARQGVISLRTGEGVGISGEIPATSFPAGLKCAAGYQLAPDMEMTDLFIGSEGTLGIITELEVSLLPVPPAIWGVVTFLPDEESAWRFVQDVRGMRTRVGTGPAAMEYFDGRALDLLRRRHEAGLLDELPPIDPAWRSAVYVEYHGEEEDLGEALEGLCAAMVRHGGSDERAWIADQPRERERVRLFRHAVPEAVNGLIAERKKTHPGLTKLGTDMAVPDECLEAVMRMYRDDLAQSGLEYVVFGHIGNNHVHVNILPRDPSDYAQGKELYLHWAARVVKMGGTVSAEHGIGKLKAPFLELMFGRAALDQWRILKRVFDPSGLFNPGNLF